MKGIGLELDTSPPQALQNNITVPDDDQLGQTLQKRWQQWFQAKRNIEEEWLKDLRAFNQINDADVAGISKFHSHIYIGLTRTKAMAAYARISDLMFQSTARHWTLSPTPIPKSQQLNTQDTFEQSKLKADAMQKEIDDQLIDIDYECAAKSAILEACIIGTGCVKGITPSVKQVTRWSKQVSEDGLSEDWVVVKEEIPAPKGAIVSCFDLYPDPYASSVENMSGIYERHILNRTQFIALKDNPQFDTDKINEILERTDKGNHIPLYHEVDRRNIAKITDTTAAKAEMYDVLEYWGQVSGRLLTLAGVDGVSETESAWCNVWTCSGVTLLAKVMPMAKQRIPYNFFIYSKVPYQFWGVPPTRMMRHTQAIVNGSVRIMLDGMAMSAIPMAEVNTLMLKDGQDPKVMKAGQIWLRDKGDQGEPAVRFFQPSVPTGALMDMIQLFKGYADDETSLPAYTYGDNSGEINQTAKGLSMQLGQAAIPIKQVIKNLEDGLIKPLIQSLYDWNMQWSDKEELKSGDMEIQVLGSSSLIAKEAKVQSLMQFLNIASSNALVAKFTDVRYLATEIAKNMDIDAEKAVPEMLPEDQQPQPPQNNVADEARAKLYEAQAITEQANAEKVKEEVLTQKETTEKVKAERINTSTKTDFTSIEVATKLKEAQMLAPDIVAIAQSIEDSNGKVDANGAPLATIPASVPTMPQQIQSEQLPPLATNTSPQDPALPVGSESYTPEPDAVQGMDIGQGQNGIETVANEGLS